MYGYYPEEPISGYECDKTMNMYYDVYNAYVKANTGGDAKAKKAAFEKACSFFSKMDERFQKCKWLLGDKICFADFWLGSFCCDVISNPNNAEVTAMFAPLLTKCPGVARFITDFKAENQGWLSERTAKTV